MLVLTGIGKLNINTGCKGYGTSAMLQTSVILKTNSSLKGDDELSQLPLRFDCCEELRLEFNVSSLPLNTEFKHVASHLDDLKHASFKISELEKEIKEQEWKNHHMIKHTAYSIMMYIYTQTHTYVYITECNFCVCIVQIV
jgi:hypothetical protein